MTWSRLKMEEKSGIKNDDVLLQNQLVIAFQGNNIKKSWTPFLYRKTEQKVLLSKVEQEDDKEDRYRAFLFSFKIFSAPR